MQTILNRATIIDRARSYLSTLPPAVSGSGGHDATFRAGCVLLHGFGLSVDEAAPLLQEWNTRCLPPWSESELAHKLTSAATSQTVRPRAYLLNQKRTSLPPPCRRPPPAETRLRWPAPDLTRIAAIVDDGPDTVGLWTLSPVPLDAEDEAGYAAPIMQALFADTDHPNPLLCVGKSSRKFATRPLAAWLATGRLAEFSFIVPARMTARTGRTREGKVSEHCLENTGPRRFVVVEFDFATTSKTTGEATMYAPLIARWRLHRPADWTENDVTRDACAALLCHLDGYASLALAVHSGGRSLHGWFPTESFQSAEVERFMAYAAMLGADTRLFANPSQFVRLPAGTREGGCRQSALYWNPATLTNLEEESE